MPLRVVDFSMVVAVESVDVEVSWKEALDGKISTL